MNNILNRKVNLRYLGCRLHNVMLVHQLDRYFVLTNHEGFDGMKCPDRKGYMYSYSIGPLSPDEFKEWCTNHNVSITKKFNHES